MLLRGIAEVEASPHPDRAAEMVLIRLAHASDLPGPGEALAMLRDGSGGAAAGGTVPTSGAAPGGAASSGSPGSSAPGGGRVVAFARATAAGGAGGAAGGGRGAAAARSLRAPDDAALDPDPGTPVGRAEPANSEPASSESVGSESVGSKSVGSEPASSRPQARGGSGRTPPRLSVVGDAPPDAPTPDPAPPAADALDPALLDPTLLDPGSVMAALYALASERRDIALQTALRGSLRLVSLDATDPARPALTLAADAGVSRRFATDLAAKLGDWTGARWAVAMGEGGGPTLAEREGAAREARLDEAALDPDVAAVPAAFPGARITDVRPSAPALGVGVEGDATPDPDAPDPEGEPDDEPDEEDAP